jgi:hypothetical protein
MDDPELLSRALLDKDGRMTAARKWEKITITRAGTVTVSAETLPPAGWEERVTGLTDLAGPDALAVVLTVRRDGCGATAELDLADPRLPGGWTTEKEGEFCPACTECGS